MGEQPRVFRAGIGGFFGPNISVEWTGSELIYDRTESGERTAWVKSRPSENDWGRFWRRCSRAGVWEWERRYDSGAVDGASWHVDIESPHGRVHSSGSNAVPPTGEMETKEFTAFCRAISNLIGGTPFC